VFGFAVLFCLATILAPASFSQSSATGALSGTVKDSSGAAVPNATVTVTSLDTNQARTATTTADGAYRVAFLPPGAYSVQFEATGFNKVEVPSVTVIVSEINVLDQTLQVGSQTQQVTVTGEAEIVQTASSSVGTLVSGQAVSDLPLTTRNYTTILGLAAGTNVNVYNAVLIGRGTQDPTVNGALPTQNNYQQDGASLINTAGGGTGADSGGATTGIGIVNPDSIQEFKIQTSSFDASYGRNSGANVNVVTKSGTNQYHGTAFEFFRNTVLNANEFFRQENVAPAPNTRPVLNQNQFGGTFGGPVKKDKLFFFASYQRTWQANGLAAAGYSNPKLVGLPLGPRGTTTFSNGVATTDAAGMAYAALLGAAFCTGGASAAGNTIAPVSGIAPTPVACNGSNINPRALALLELKTPGSAGAGGYYVPGVPTGPGPNAGTAFSSPAHYIEDQGVGNFDYVLNPKNTISGRYFYSAVQTIGTIGTGTTSSAISQGVPGSPGSVRFPNMYMVAKLTTVATSNLVNEFRASLQRSVVFDFPGFVNADGSLVTNTQLGVEPVEPTYDVSNRFTIKGLMALGTGVAVARKFNTSWEVADQVSWTHGKHTIRAGFEYERDRNNWYFPALAGGGNANETFNTFDDFLVGLPGCSPTLTAAQCAATQAPNNAAPLPGQTNGSAFSNIANGGTATSITAPAGDNHFFRTQAGNFFVQDDIKLTNSLTLNLGVRYEYNGLFYDQLGNATNVFASLINTANTLGTVGNSPTCPGTFVANPSNPTCIPGTLAGFVVPSNFNPSLYATPTVGGLFQNTQQVPTQNRPPRDAFAPRLGFAWKPLATDRFVVRGGFGTFYDRSGIAGYNSAVVQNFPYAVPVFQSTSAANWQATEAIPYPAADAARLASPATGGLGWAAATRWENINTTAQTGTGSNLNVIVMDPHFQVPTTYQWNLNTQYEFLSGWVLETGYVGSHSIHQLYTGAGTAGGNGFHEINEPTLATATTPVNGITTNTSSNAALRVPFLGFTPGGLAYLTPAGKTLFDSLQVTVRKQLTHGLTMQTAYTWSRVLTTVDHATYNDPNTEHYGPSAYYRPHRLTISYGYDLPLGHHDGLMGKFANGWNVAGVTVIQDGQPLTLVDARGGAVYGFANSGAVSSTAFFAAGMNASNVALSGPIKNRLSGFFNTAAFLGIPGAALLPKTGATPGGAGDVSWGNAGYGIVLGPGQFNFDATIQKTTTVGGIHEDAKLVFRTEFFNAFNHAQFNSPTGGQLDASSSTFGQINSTSVNPRLIQLALKYVF
jgi:hypothetical protein